MLLKKTVAFPISVALYYAPVVSAFAAVLLMCLGAAAAVRDVPLVWAGVVALSGAGVGAVAYGVHRPGARRARREELALRVAEWADPPLPVAVRPAAAPASVTPVRSSTPAGHASVHCFPVDVYPAEPRELAPYELPSWSTCTRCDGVPISGTCSWDTRTPLLISRYRLTCSAGHSWLEESDGG